MSSAPAWVTYAALLLSALSLLVSAMTYRAGGPRLRLETAQLPRGDSRFPSGSGVRLTVINAGRTAVTVQNFAVTPYGERKPAIPVKNVHGPALPHRLEPHASDTWEADALPAARASTTR